MDSIMVNNKVNDFLEFYELANNNDLNNEERWLLWEEHYNFAAIPPGDEGKEIAKRMFLQSWEKYHEHIDNIKQWKPNNERIQYFFSKVKQLLAYNQHIRITVFYFVGFFEKNAFVAPYKKDEIALCLPIETEKTQTDSDKTLCHELTHIVHSKTANLSLNWEQDLGTLLLKEGLATQVSKAIIPGENDSYYVEHQPGWFEKCQEKKTLIIEGIGPYLDKSSSDVLWKFTFGTGTTNQTREAYFAGWEIIQFLLDQGYSFSELAHISEKDIPDFIKNTINRFKEELKI